MESLARRTRVCCVYAAAITGLACGGDASQQPTTPVAVVPTPTPPPVGPLHANQVFWNPNVTAWAGTAFVATPQVRVERVVAGNVPLGVSGVRVKFAVTSGSGTIRDTAVLTDSFGFASSGSWTLGTSAGVNTVTATVDSVGSLSFSVFASTKPNIVASYALSSSNLDAYSSQNALLVFGDDGSFEYSWNSDLHGFDGNPGSGSYRSWTVFPYSTDGSTIIFGRGWMETPASNPDVIGVPHGDTLIVSFLDGGYDQPLPVRLVYVRSKISGPASVKLPRTDWSRR